MYNSKRNKILIKFKDTLNAASLLSNKSKNLNTSSVIPSNLLGKSAIIKQSAEKQSFKLENLLILSKITRYEFEKKRFSNLTENELKQKLTENGSNYKQLLKHHDEHYHSLEATLDALNTNHINTKIIQRQNYSTADIDWSDAILTAGGDGTFLLAAAKVTDSNKPVIGINTDTSNSAGHLLLPSEQSQNFSKTLNKILRGEFKWLLRTRLRIAVEGTNLKLNPIELHDQVLNLREYRFIEHVEEHRVSSASDNNFNTTKTNEKQKFLIPYRALNEVFIGESLSSRVSYYKMSIDDQEFFKQKSSGIILCTGTGSTSWCYNIHKTNPQSLKEILNIMNKTLNNKMKIPNDDEFISNITKQFNDSIVFNPSELQMAYTIRDPIINRVFKNETTRGFANKVAIQSRCFDACLVIDGGLSYQFNSGAKAIVEIHPEDSLKTIIVDA